MFKRGDVTSYLLLYIDDFILITSTSDFLELVIKFLTVEFAMIDLGLISYFLEISATSKMQTYFSLKRNMPLKS